MIVRVDLPAIISLGNLMSWLTTSRISAIKVNLSDAFAVAPIKSKGQSAGVDG